ncbi:VOC family protein [Nostocoides vanveenii]|uniref:VOC family protein n=1 Tax=Nostocoides vanveenii TaxID=330835 RepID=A0ABP4WXG0_9MICO
MTERRKMARRAASEAVVEAGWQFILGGFETWVPAQGISEAIGIATIAGPAAPGDAGLGIDIRPDGIRLRIQDPATGWVEQPEVDAAQAITARLREHGYHPGGQGPGPHVQRLELALDTLDEDRIKPFWRAVLDYVDGPDGDLVDPRDHGPSVWFQAMDHPRPQRNRIHFDITVPHEQAQTRIDAGLATGGRLLSTEYAPSFWVLADPEGNEICICTWLDRDERRDAVLAAQARARAQEHQADLPDAR